MQNILFTLLFSFFSNAEIANVKNPTKEQLVAHQQIKECVYRFSSVDPREGNISKEFNDWANENKKEYDKLIQAISEIAGLKKASWISGVVSERSYGLIKIKKQDSSDFERLKGLFIRVEAEIDKNGSTEKKEGILALWRKPPDYKLVILWENVECSS